MGRVKPAVAGKRLQAIMVGAEVKLRPPHKGIQCKLKPNKIKAFRTIPYAEAVVWLPLELARERYFGGEPLAKSKF